jgi:hypothetical protein
MYVGQKLFHEMVHKIENFGLEICSIEPAFVNKSTGRVLQVDVIFVKG